MAWDPSARNGTSAIATDSTDKHKVDHEEPLEGLTSTAGYPTEAGKTRRGRARGRLHKEVTVESVAPEEQQEQGNEDMDEPADEEEEESTEAMTAEEGKSRLLPLFDRGIY